MLTCQELVELITDYVEGALDAKLHDAVSRHLGDCDDCLRYVAQLQATGRALASLPTETLSDDDRSELVATFRDWCERQG
jgi:anti-sigma factor RsiW